MFDVHCTACDTRRLVFPGQIRALVHDEQGIIVLYTCWCGAHGAERAGRLADRPSVLAGDRPVRRGEHVLAS